MPNGTYFQSAPPPAPSLSDNHQSTTTGDAAPDTPTADTSNEGASKLAEAIDDFLGDLEKKFKGISDEILTKLDDMAERCDRLEQEMLVRDAGADVGKKD